MPNRRPKTSTPPEYGFSRERDGCDDLFAVRDRADHIIAQVRFWDCVDGEEAEAETTARLIVHRLNRHPELLAALDQLLAIFDEEIAAGVMWHDNRIAQARRAYARAARPVTRNPRKESRP